MAPKTKPGRPTKESINIANDLKKALKDLQSTTDDVNSGLSSALGIEEDINGVVNEILNSKKTGLKVEENIGKAAVERVKLQSKLLNQLSNKNKKIDFVSAIELARVGDKNGLEHIIRNLKGGPWHTRQSLLDLTHNLKLWKSIKWENFDTQLKSNLISALNNFLHLYPTRETYYTDEIELFNLTILALEKIGDSENIAEIKQYLKGKVEYKSEKEANIPRFHNKYSLQEKLGNFSMEVLGRIGSSDEIKFLEDLQRDPVLKNDNMCSRKTKWEISINKALAMLYKKELDKLKLPNL